MARYCDNKSLDFRKFNNHFQLSIVKELDFKQEIVNLERTRSAFWKYTNDLYLPETHIWKSSKRCIVMEFCKGNRIDEIDEINKKFGEGGALKAAEILVDVFG